MDFRLRRQSLLERAKHIEEGASRVENAKPQDLMRALALLYKEMAEELGESGLFERRFPPFDFQSRRCSLRKGRLVHNLANRSPSLRRFFIQAYLDRDMTLCCAGNAPKEIVATWLRVSLLEIYHERHTLREDGRLRRNCSGRG